MSNFAKTSALRVAYETYGENSGNPIVLIRGLGTQMIEWSEVLLNALVDAGHFVVVFDNRDVGLSRGFEEAGTEVPAYTLTDMAGDTVGLLDHLHIDRAHFVGMSMGGMIAQRLAIAFPQRVFSITSIMSSSGRRDLPPPSKEAGNYLTAVPANPDDEDEVVELVATGRLCFDGPAYPTDRAVHREMARRAFRRANRPDGTARQLATALADGDRRSELASINLPVLVIHGTHDPLLPLGHGLDTAEAIPGARMEIVEGMGHAIPDSLAPLLAELIISHTHDSG